MGLSPSLPLPARVADGGVVTCELCVVEGVARVEFFRVAAPELAPEAPADFLEDLVLAPPPPTGRLAPDPRLRFLITSVFRLKGRTTPWSFRNKPHALQRGCPSGFRLHNGVVWVKQFVHVVGALLSP
jgi:hypothetical protein